MKKLKFKEFCKDVFSSICKELDIDEKEASKTYTSNYSASASSAKNQIKMKKLKFKVGDKVKCVKEENFGMEDGWEGVVVGFNEYVEGDCDMLYRVESENMVWNQTEKSLELITNK